MKTVYTCFCTDVIHAGHLNIINEAKKLGSMLIAPEHIIIAVLREGQSVGARILSEFDIDFLSSDLNSLIKL